MQIADNNYARHVGGTHKEAAEVATPGESENKTPTTSTRIAQR